MVGRYWIIWFCRYWREQRIWMVWRWIGKFLNTQWMTICVYAMLRQRVVFFSKLYINIAVPCGVVIAMNRSILW